ncbi:hypothetical protein [Kribbella alba]|uniref:hypothetical protein n=1 Tax=Kribbella alba TaxID=190197 RepID=UPI0031CFBB12
MILLGALAAYVLSHREVRSSTADVAKAFLQPKIMAPIVAFGVYLTAAVWAASQVNLWEREILKDTIIWGLLTGLALLFKTTDAKSVGFFRDTALRTIGLSAFVEFFVNIESFHLVVELVLQAVLILVVGMLAVTSNDEDQRQLKRLLEGFLTLVGVILIVTTAWKLGQNWSSVDKGLLWRSLALPVWLTVAALPYIYGLSLVMGYGTTFSRLKLVDRPRSLSLKLRVAVVVGLGWRLRYVHGFTGPWAMRLGRTSSFTEGRALVNEFRASFASANVGQ